MASTRRGLLAAVGATVLAGGAADARRPPDASARTAAGWRSFQRGPGNTGHVPAGAGPWDGVDGRWRAGTEAAFGQPVAVVRGGDVTVYASTANGAVRAYAAATGERRWTATPGNRRSSVPAVGPDGTVYVTSDRAVHALDPASGDARTLLDAGGGFDPADPRGPAPAVADDTLYTVAGGRLVALSLPDGDVRWEVDPGAGAADAPAVADGRVHVGSAAFDAATGARRWSVDRTTFHPPAAAGGRVFAVTGRGLEAFDAASGDPLWLFDGGGGDRRIRAPAVADGTVLAGGMGTTSGLFALDATTGDVRWSERSGYLAGPPAVAGDAVYALMPDGRRASQDDYWWGLRAFELGSGDERWARKLRDRNSFGSVAVAGDGVYAVDGDRLHALAGSGEGGTAGRPADRRGPEDLLGRGIDWLVGPERWYAPAAAWLGAQVVGPLVLGALVALDAASGDGDD